MARVPASFVLGVALLLACGKSKPAAERKPTTCKQNSDCAEGWVCLARKCADPSGKAVYMDPAHAVTPDKVRDEVEDVQKRHDDDIDERMKKAEQDP